VRLARQAQSALGLALPGRPDSGGELRIGRNRKLFGVAVVFFGALAAGGLSRETSAGSVIGTIIVVVVFGLPCLFYAGGLLKGGPAIIVDAAGLTDRRSGRAVSWATTSTIVLRQRQGVFGEYHHLVCTTTTGDTVELSIDQLSLGWRTVVSAVEERANMTVTTRGERCFASR
jgi:hypothetical protein